MSTTSMSRAEQVRRTMALRAATRAAGSAREMSMRDRTAPPSRVSAASPQSRASASPVAVVVAERESSPQSSPPPISRMTSSTSRLRAPFYIRSSTPNWPGGEREHHRDRRCAGEPAAGPHRLPVGLPKAGETNGLEAADRPAVLGGQPLKRPERALEELQPRLRALFAREAAVLARLDLGAARRSAVLRPTLVVRAGSAVAGQSPVRPATRFGD